MTLFDLILTVGPISLTVALVLLVVSAGGRK
jgi:hypothetical protein